jgi:antitoxin component YwqK of YwqJK toxin-antitoxin module
LIKELEVFSPILSEVMMPAEEVIVGRDYIFLRNYEPENTLFYYENEVFTGVAKYDDSSHLTFISFLEGKIHGKWYDETIWNNHLTFEGQYVNGFKNGIWKESSDGKLYRTENYFNDMLHGKQVTYYDYFSSTDRTYKLDGVKINTTAQMERNYLQGVLTEETFLISNETLLNGELTQIDVQEGDTLRMNCEFYKNGKFTGVRQYCYNDYKLISLEYHLLESGLVEKKEYDCNSGMVYDEGLYKPNKLFTSDLNFMNEEDFERQ